MRYATVAVTAAAILATGMVSTSEAATPAQLIGGVGWKLTDPFGTNSIGPGAYTIEFDSDSARDKLSPYLRVAASSTQKHTAGTTFTVTSTVRARVPGQCPKRNTILVSLDYRPVAKAGYSWAGSCYNLRDLSLWSGDVRIDSEWFQPQYFAANTVANQARIRNGVTHEFGHALGLGHPNYDRDHDGAVEAHECAWNRDGYKPVMCAPNGGSLVNAGNWTPMDAAGLRALIANYAYRSVNGDGS